MADSLLLDMDGVLLVGKGTDPAVYREAADLALSDLGVVDPPTDVVETLGRPPYDEETAAACDRLGVPTDAFWAARERYASRLTNRRVRSGERAVYDDVDAVRAIATELPVGVASNNRRATVAFVADHLFDGDLAVAVGREPTLSDYRTRRKPEPDIVRRALPALPDDPLYVGDRQKDVVAARRAGIDVAFVRRPHNRDVRLDPEPDLVIEDLGDLRMALDVDADANPPPGSEPNPGSDGQD